MMIDKDTTLCVSIAQKPGNFGATVFNTAFRELNMNWIYKPLQIDPENLEDALKAIRIFGIRGCGVSMPHKQSIMPLLDDIDETAEKIGAVNTVVNNSGKLKGYNTDYTGAKQALSEALSLKGKSVLLLGAGGVARAIIMALKDLGAEPITICNRDEEKAKALVEEFSLNICSYKNRASESADLLVNATPIGMPPNTDETPVESVENFSACLDVIATPQKTMLIKSMEKQGKLAIQGFRMALYQGLEQFRLYTGKEASKESIEKAIQHYFSK